MGPVYSGHHRNPYKVGVTEYAYVHSNRQHFLFNKSFQVALYHGYINDLL